jgi:hypothetical protein
MRWAKAFHSALYCVFLVHIPLDVVRTITCLGLPQLYTSLSAWNEHNEHSYRSGYRWLPFTGEWNHLLKRDQAKPAAQDGPVVVCEERTWKHTETKVQHSMGIHCRTVSAASRAE